MIMYNIVMVTAAVFKKEITNFAGAIAVEEDVPCSYVSVNKGLLGEVSHARGHLLTEPQEQQR